MRLKFWLAVHDSLEKAWHWVYYHKVKPLQPPTRIIDPANRYYFLGRDEDYDYYRSI